jgi:GTPase SAR1 family protein
MRASFEAVTTHWFGSVRMKISEHVPVILIGNKCDLDSEGFRNEAMAFGEENDCLVCFTSAKTREGIKDCLQVIVERAVNERAAGIRMTVPTPASIEVIGTPPATKNGCCG